MRSPSVPPVGEYDAIIVLGAQVKPDGVPSLQLQWRIDAAAKAWKERSSMIVVCGVVHHSTTYICCIRSCRRYHFPDS